MDFITRTPPFDLESNYPEFRSLKKTTVRLHPRKRPGLPATASKIGGTFFSNHPDLWPRCTEHDTHHLGVMQITKADVPELGFPDEQNLFQLTFCPFDHEDEYCPAVRGRWLSVSTKVTQRESNPSTLEPVDPLASTYSPVECGFHPERVTEFPHVSELPESLLTRLNSDRELASAIADYVKPSDERFDNEDAYQSLLSTADGTKVGGHINWIQWPWLPPCDNCSGPTDHLLTLASWEWDGGTYHRWKPSESAADSRTRSLEGGEDHGMMFGDAGAIYVSVCRRCQGWPVYRTFHCS